MMFATNRGWIGIDVGSHTVKLVQTVRQAGRIELAEALVIRRADAWPESADDKAPTISSSEEISAGLSLGTNFRGKAAAVALPMTMCDIQSCFLEDGSEHEMRSQVVEQLAPVLGDVEQLREFDYWLTQSGQEQGSPEENGLAASVSHGWAQQVARDLSGAGLVGKILDVLPMAIARAIEIGAPGSSNSPVIAVDWGYRRATFCAVLHGRPVFVRCLRESGYASVATALTKALSLSSEESQKLLTERGVVPRDGSAAEELQSVIEEVTADALTVFVEELQRTLGFLRQHHRGLTPTKLVLFGGGAAIRNMESFLEAQLELSVEKWSFMGMPAASRARIPVELLGPAVALSSLAWSKA